MIHPIRLARVFPLVMLALAVGCGADREGLPAAADATALQGRQPASEQARQASGLSHLPRPLNLEALDRSLAAHYPRGLVGARPRTAVLVDVALDESGFVRDVAVVDRAGLPENVRMVLVDRVPGSNVEVQREAATTYDPAFGPAAVAALKEVRFHPALRDGRPVPYTLRMTVEFTSPAPS